MLNDLIKEGFHSVASAQECLELPPHHLVHHAGVDLDNLVHLGGDGLVDVVVNGSLEQRSLGDELDGGADGPSRRFLPA